MKIGLLSTDANEAMSEIDGCVQLQKDVGWSNETVASHVFRADAINMIDPSIDLGYVVIAKRSEVHGFARVTTSGNQKVHWLHEIVVGIKSQAKNLGFEIMLEAKKVSLAKGAEAIFFTYDPMEAQNGNLYLGKCRAEATKVYENFYGVLSSSAHANRLTHRFLVEWWFKRPPLDLPDLVSIPVATENLPSKEKIFKIEIPYKVQSLTPIEAQNWQVHVYGLLVEAINRMGYRAVFLEVDKTDSRCFLLLAR